MHSDPTDEYRIWVFLIIILIFVSFLAYNLQCITFCKNAIKQKAKAKKNQQPNEINVFTCKYPQIHTPQLAFGEIEIAQKKQSKANKLSENRIAIIHTHLNTFVIAFCLFCLHVKTKMTSMQPKGREKTTTTTNSI